jgi:hypothetical protein
MTFKFGAGAQDANVFIPFDVQYHQTSQDRTVCTEIEEDPTFWQHAAATIVTAAVVIPKTMQP